MINCLIVGIGGFIGSVLRYLAGKIPVAEMTAFPVMTLLINVVGALVLSLAVAMAGKTADFNPQLLLLIKVGICGGFTTFSTFAFEAQTLISQGRVGMAIGYMMLSMILGVLAVFLGEYIVK